MLSPSPMLVLAVALLASTVAPSSIALASTATRARSTLAIRAPIIIPASGLASPSMFDPYHLLSPSKSASFPETDSGCIKEMLDSHGLLHASDDFYAKFDEEDDHYADIVGGLTDEDWALLDMEATPDIYDWSLPNYDGVREAEEDEDAQDLADEEEDDQVETWDRIIEGGEVADDEAWYEADDEEPNTFEPESESRGTSNSSEFPPLPPAVPSH